MLRPLLLMTLSLFAIAAERDVIIAHCVAQAGPTHPSITLQVFGQQMEGLVPISGDNSAINLQSPKQSLKVPWSVIDDRQLCTIAEPTIREADIAVKKAFLVLLGPNGKGNHLHQAIAQELLESDRDGYKALIEKQQQAEPPAIKTKKTKAAKKQSEANSDERTVLVGPDHQGPTYDFTAPLVTPEQADKLQAALDRYAKIRLSPGDYTRAGIITVRSKQFLYGLPGTKLAGIDILPGTKGAGLYGISAREIRFLPGAEIANNTFFRLEHTNVTSQGASVANNLFIGLLWSKIDIDNSTQGYLRNNRFIRTTVHATFPQLVLRGNPRHPDESRGNVFLWFNFLTAAGDVTWIEHQKDLSIVASDSESWNFDGKGGKPLFHTGKMGTLRVFAAQGGNHQPPARLTPLLATEADTAVFLGVRLEEKNLRSPNILLGENNKHFVMLGGENYSIKHDSNETLRFTGFNKNKIDLQANGANDISKEQATSLASMIYDQERKGTAWATPLFDPIEPYENPDWRKDAQDAADSSAEIQARLDAGGLTYLEPGVYYLQSPLILRSKYGLIGAGPDKTILIAKNPEMDLIQIVPSHGKNQAFTLGHLTLMGGKVGLACRQTTHITAVTNGYFSNLHIRDMSEAGILTHKIYAWDNNLIDHVNFINCKNGLLQIADPTWDRKDSFNAMFLDKNFWYRCQFISCGVPLNLRTIRPNNLNTYYECHFSESTEYITDLYNNQTTVFANCRFNENAGNPMFQGNQKISLVSCWISPRSNGQSVFGTAVDMEGCTFVTNKKTNTRLFAAPTKAPSLILNCNARGFLADELVNGMAINSILDYKQKTIDASVVMFSEHGNKLLNRDTSTPAPQLLFESD